MCETNTNSILSLCCVSRIKMKWNCVLLFFHASTLNLSLVSLPSVYNRPFSVYAFMHSRSIYQLLFPVCVKYSCCGHVGEHVCVCAWRIRALEAASSGRLRRTGAIYRLLSLHSKRNGKEGSLTQLPTPRSAMQHGEREDEGGLREGGREVRVWEGVWGWCDQRRREGWVESLLKRGLQKGMAEVGTVRTRHQKIDLIVLLVLFVYICTPIHLGGGKFCTNPWGMRHCTLNQRSCGLGEKRKRKRTPSRKTHRGKPKFHRVWCTTMSRPQLHRVLIMRWPLTADFMQNVKVFGVNAEHSGGREV